MSFDTPNARPGGQNGNEMTTENYDREYAAKRRKQFVALMVPRPLAVRINRLATANRRTSQAQAGLVIEAGLAVLEPDPRPTLAQVAATDPERFEQE